MSGQLVERRGALRWAMSPYGNSLLAARTALPKKREFVPRRGCEPWPIRGDFGSFLPRLHGQPYLGSIKRMAAKRRQLLAE